MKMFSKFVFFLACCSVGTKAFSVQSPLALGRTKAAPSPVILHEFSFGNADEAGTARATVGLTEPVAKVSSATLNRSVGKPMPAAPGNSGALTIKDGDSAADAQFAKKVWDSATPVTVQGGSLRTCSFATTAVERVLVSLRTEGRPLNANIELWHGPDNTPQKMAVYCEDGYDRPFNCVIQTPRGHNAVAIRNTANLEFPLEAYVEADVEDMKGSPTSALVAATKKLEEGSPPRIIQGGALRTYPFDPAVESVQIMLMTDGRPLNARIELLQGPNNEKEVLEMYTEDGMERPFFAVLETPGTGNVVRIVNTAPVEFPLTARVEPYVIQSSESLANGVWSHETGGRIMSRDPLGPDWKGGQKTYDMRGAR